MNALDNFLNKHDKCPPGTCPEECDLLYAEIELLREAAFLYAYDAAHDGTYCDVCSWSPDTPEDITHDCLVARILRTDPDRTQKMGLGWAL